MQPNSPRKPREDSPPLFLSPRNPTKPKPVTPLSLTPSPFLKIIQSFTQDQPHYHYDICQSSTFLQLNKTTLNYHNEIVINLIENSQELDVMLNNPSRYMCYELMEYCLAMVGPIGVSLDISDKVGLYIPTGYLNEQENKIEINGKRVIRVERRLKKGKEGVFDYPYFVCEPIETLFPTLIFKWLNCLRSSFLEAYFGVDQSNYYMILGLAGHSLLEKLVKKEILPSINKEEFYKKIYVDQIDKMYLLNIKEQDFVKDCLEKFQNIFQFYINHILNGKQIQINKYKKEYLKITKIIGPEYTLKSQIFGIKGKVDLLLECLYISRQTGKQRPVIVPFQLKTGYRQCHTHINQVHVYNLLILQLFKTQPLGLLFYPLSKKVIPVITDTMNVQEILVKRNEYVVNRKRKVESAKVKLPKHTVNASTCGKCKIQRECVAVSLTEFRDIEEIGELQNFEMEEAKKWIGLIEPQGKEYVQKWLGLLHLQQRAKERQYYNGLKSGLTCLKLQDVTKFLFNIADKKQISQIALRSRQLNEGETANMQNMYKPGDKLRMNILIVRSAIYIEVEKVKRLNRRVYLVCKVNLSNVLFDVKQIKGEMLDVELEKFGYLDNYSHERYTVIDYCIKETKHESYKYIIGNENPKQFPVDNEYKYYYAKYIRDSQQYNKEQKQAIRKALVMKDFSLVEGYPGTGKTFLILQLIKIFRQLNLKVLVTSFTNTSLDNILRKLLEMGENIQPHILRIGNKGLRVGEFKHVSFDPRSFTTTDSLSTFLSSKSIFLVTLTSLYNQLISSNFDLVIIDQASQCIQPLCLNAITRARKFILVGDYKQLGPIIQDDYAAEQGMKVSLFERLCKGYPEATTALVKQWRMCSEIMELTNRLVYGGKLECANEGVETRVLKVDQGNGFEKVKEVKQIVDPFKPIRFLTMDTISSTLSQLDSQTSTSQLLLSPSTSIFKLQTHLASSLYSLFRSLHLPRSSISIISFYNRTNTHIIKQLQSLSLIQSNQGDVFTIDKSQGIDKECVVFLMESGGERNRLMRDIRRLNVSLTRAKSKLLIIGSQREAEMVFNKEVYGLLMKNQVRVTERLVEELTGERK